MSYMAEEFKAVLKKYGHDVYLQRRLPDSTCEEPVFETKLEIWTVRYNSMKSLTAAQQEEFVGIFNNSERIYYFQTEARPKDGDRIYENPDEDYRAWTVDAVAPMRGDGGDLEYYVAGATRTR